MCVRGVFGGGGGDGMWNMLVKYFLNNVKVWDLISLVIAEYTLLILFYFWWFWILTG